VTRRTVAERWREHRNKKGYRLQEAISSDGAGAFDIHVLKVDQEWSTLAAAEKALILRLRSHMPDRGFNVAAHAQTERQRRAMLAAVQSPEHRARQREKRLAYLAAHPEARERISTSLQGRPVSQETRARLSEAHAGKKLSAEHRAAISARQIGKTGRTMSPEARAKISAARKGKALSAEHRAKLSAAKKGRSDITEHCRRIAPLGARKARTAASSLFNHFKFSKNARDVY
jgi:hypothetical protein